jgi:ADP-dependent phosphofructokinase/glucokinase
MEINNSKQNISILKENDNAKIKIELPILENNDMNRQVTDYVSSFLNDFKENTNNFEKLSNNWKYELDISGVSNKV